MIFAMIVIIISWFLNACMDAIDHGSGASNLGKLWHILKWFSYAIPFGYIMLFNHIKIVYCIALVIFLGIVWELMYNYLRAINFYKLDK